MGNHDYTSTINSLNRATWAEGFPRTHRLRAAALKAVIAAFDQIAAWQARARQRAELARLDARELKDIGISRAQAEAEAAKPFWKK